MELLKYQETKTSMDLSAYETSNRGAKSQELDSANYSAKLVDGVTVPDITGYQVSNSSSQTIIETQIRLLKRRVSSSVDAIKFIKENKMGAMVGAITKAMELYLSSSNIEISLDSFEGIRVLITARLSNTDDFDSEKSAYERFKKEWYVRSESFASDLVELRWN